MTRPALAALASILAAAACAAAAAGASAETGRVASVTDGDTIVLAGGERVRLVQLDAPELRGSECYGRAAAARLRSMLPVGSAVVLEADPRLDRVDRYGRLLRYVRRGGVNVNLELVRRGAATVWFYRGDRGRYAATLLAAARSARAARLGLWGACPSAVWDPTGPATTGTAAVASSRSTRGGCDPSYPTVCIPPAPPDLDCGDVPYRRFRVLPPDPHHFDGRDHDGVGCES